MSKKRSLVSYPKIILAFVLLIILSVSVSAWVDVVDNTASGESCKDFCGHLNGICMDVGIDTDGTNDQICDQCDPWTNSCWVDDCPTPISADCDTIAKSMDEYPWQDWIRCMCDVPYASGMDVGAGMMGGICTDSDECAPCTVCVDRGGVGTCIWACSKDKKCDIYGGPETRGSLFLRTWHEGRCGDSGSNLLEDVNCTFNETYGEANEDVELGLYLYDSTSNFIRGTYNPDGYPVTLDYSDSETDIVAAGEGWFYSLAITSSGLSTSEPNLLAPYDTLCTYRPSLYLNYDEDQGFCEARGGAWLSGDADDCPEDVPGLCVGSCTDGVCCENSGHGSGKDIAGKDYFFSICQVDSDNCQEWCNTDGGTCWGDDTDAGEDADDGDNNDLLCISSLFDGVWEGLVSVDHQCCGDDPAIGEDCTYIENEWFCYDDSGGDWYWEDASESDNAGLVIEPDCGNTLFVSDRTTWLECDDDVFKAVGTPLSVPYPISSDASTLPHDYLCNNSKIFECTGDSGVCLSGSAEYCMGEGAVITVELQPDPFFCDDEANWTPLTGGAYDMSESVCVGSDYTWLGDGKCCGDGKDDTFVTDTTPFKACLDGNVTLNGYLAADTDGTVLTLNGKFLTCGYGVVEPDTIFEEVVACNISGYPSPMIDSYYCNISLDTDEELGWVSLTTDPPSAISGITELSVKDSPSPDTHGCCPLEYCWTGTECIANTGPSWGYDEYGVGYTPEYYPGDLLYHCNDSGSWVSATTKVDQNHLDRGFCAEDQCYHSNENCYEIGEYVGDDYCEITFVGIKSWEWTTRTKLVALDLLKIVYNGDGFTKDFTLACGDYDKMINRIETPQGVAGDYDKFCVLEYDDIRVLGVALEQGTIDVQGQTFLQTIGYYYDECAGAMAGGYEMCNENPKLWFNNDTETLIFSNANIYPETRESDFFGVIYGYLYAAIDWIRGIPRPDSWPSQLSWSDGHAQIHNLDNTARFDRLYISKKGSKQVFGVLEKPRGGPAPLPYSGNPPGYADNTQYYQAIEYTGFDIDICDYVEEYDDRFCGVPASEFDCFYCKKDVATYRVFAGYEGYIVHAWFDLTSKLRLE